MVRLDICFYTIGPRLIRPVVHVCASLYQSLLLRFQVRIPQAYSFTMIVEESVFTFSYFLVFWYCPFNFIQQRLLLMNSPTFLLYLCIYRSFYWRFYLLFFLSPHIRAAFIEEFISVWLILTIRCNNLKTPSLFILNCRRFYFSTFSAFAWFVKNCLTVGMACPTRQ